MNKSELIDALAARFEGNRKQAADALEKVLDTITREVARGEKVAITGFGSFEKQIKKAGWARNPSTGERIRTKSRAVPKFRPGADLKNVVSGAKKLPKLTLDAANNLAPAAARPAVRKTTAALGGGSADDSGTAKKSGSTAKKSSTSKSGTSKKSGSSSSSSPAKKSAAKKSSSSASSTSTAKKSSPAKKSSSSKSAAAKKSSPAKKSSSSTKKSTGKKSSAAKKS